MILCYSTKTSFHVKFMFWDCFLAMLTRETCTRISLSSICRVLVVGRWAGEDICYFTYHPQVTFFQSWYACPLVPLHTSKLIDIIPTCYYYFGSNQNHSCMYVDHLQFHTFDMHFVFYTTMVEPGLKNSPELKIIRLFLNDFSRSAEVKTNFILICKWRLWLPIKHAQDFSLG